MIPVYVHNAGFKIYGSRSAICPSDSANILALRMRPDQEILLRPSHLVHPESGNSTERLLNIEHYAAILYHLTRLIEERPSCGDFIDSHHAFRLHELRHTISANSVGPTTHLAYRLSLDSMVIYPISVCGVNTLL